jgi:hypothetical protein
MTEAAGSLRENCLKILISGVFAKKKNLAMKG